MNARLFSLSLVGGFVLLISPVSAQCVKRIAPPECWTEEVSLSDLGRSDAHWLKFLPREGHGRFLTRVKLETSVTDPSQPFANGEAALWPSTDLWQPRMGIKAEVALYQSARSSGAKISFGYVRGSRSPNYLQNPHKKNIGVFGIIIRTPFTLLD